MCVCVIVYMVYVCVRLQNQIFNIYNVSCKDYCYGSCLPLILIIQKINKLDLDR